jgi:hypothetical protein
MNKKIDRRKKTNSNKKRTEKKMTTPVNKEFPNKLKEMADRRAASETDQRIGSEEPENPTDK